MNNSSSVAVVTTNVLVPGWLAFQVLTPCLCLIATYIFAALVRYEIINGKFRGPYMNPSFVMKITAMLASLSVMASTVTTQLNLLVTFGSFSNQLRVCAISSTLHFFFTNIGLTSTYIFLWLRQYSFYKGSSFSHLNSSCVKAVSKVTIAVIVLTFIAFAVVNGSNGIVAKAADVGCSYLGISSFSVSCIRCITAMRFVMTMTLFGLFLYPLVVRSGTTDGSNSLDDRNVSDEIKRAIRISIISVCFCMSSNGLVILLGNFLIGIEVPAYYIASCCDLSLLVNTAVLVFTYDKFPDILFGCCRRRRSEFV